MFGDPGHVSHVKGPSPDDRRTVLDVEAWTGYLSAVEMWEDRALRYVTDERSRRPLRRPIHAVTDRDDAAALCGKDLNDFMVIYCHVDDRFERFPRTDRCSMCNRLATGHWQSGPPD